MRLRKRFFSFLLMLVTGLMLAGTASAQSTTSAVDETKGWTFFEDFLGSANSLGQVTKLDSTLGYNFNRYFGVDAGLPVYFVHLSNSTISMTSTSGSRTNTGLGDLYADLRFTFDTPVVNYVSTLRGSAPTGDTSIGLSTGRATYDWNNHFDRSFGRLTPYLDLGIANSVSDTSFFLRPFTSLGTVGQFDLGAQWKFFPALSFDASVYDVAPTGQQKIFSKFLKHNSTGPAGPAGHGRVFQNAPETVGSADLAKDNGFAAGFDITPSRYFDLGIGYSRSVHFALNTFYWNVGVNVGSLIKTARGQ